MVSAFLYSLAAGVLGVVATGKPGDIAWKFLRLVGFLALLIACAAAVWPFVAENDAERLSGIWSTSASVLLVCSSIALVFVAPPVESSPFPRPNGRGPIEAFCMGTP